MIIKRKGLEGWAIVMEQYMNATLNMEILAGLPDLFGMTRVGIKANVNKVWNMAKVNMSKLMVKFKKVVLKMMSLNHDWGQKVFR